MRIALIGDLQYAPGEDGQIREYIHQVNGTNPNFAVFMGDMGCHGRTGTAEGMRACRDFLAELRCPVAALMGNHDVEYRPDDPMARTPDKWYAELFGREHPWQALERDGVFLLCLSVERQPEETLYTQHALYASDEQYRWAKAQLESHRSMPTVVFSHAPVAGSGLRCFPPIHSAATDAHMDHTFDALRWRELIRENPQIRAWCSAHFHMGHDYDAAIVHRDGVVHISAGVLTSAARDGSRHTRILDVNEECAIISTLNHLENGLRKDASIPMMSGERPEGRISIGLQDELLLGEDKIRNAFTCPKWNRAYVSTEKGKLWEFDRALQEISGAICLEQPVHALSQEADRLYVETEHGEIFSIRKDDGGRFERLSGYVPQRKQIETALRGRCLPKMEYTIREAREGEYILLKF